MNEEQDCQIFPNCKCPALDICAVEILKEKIVKTMEEEYDRGWQVGYNEAEEYYRKGGSFK